MRSATLSAFLLLCACDADSDPTPSTPPPAEVAAEAQTEPEEPGIPEVETGYAIHEWGFIAHHYADDDGDLLTNGTVPAAEWIPRVEHHGRGGGKPVIYVHLQGEGDIARFTASLSTAGRFLEEWPHSEGSTPTNLTWDVEARRESCSARNRYPRAGDRHCSGIADHYCEAAELAHYETQDSACLTVGGERWNHLFYRARIAGDVPLRVSKRGAVFTVQNTGALPGRLMRIRRAADAIDTRVVVFDPPASSESLGLPPTPDQPAATGIAALEAELGALGMSEDEVGAFMTAWQAELFGDTAERTQVPMVGTPPRDLRAKEDALIYFLPTASLDAMVPLAFTPPPTEVRRAVLVRVDLGEAYVAPQDTDLGSLPSTRPLDVPRILFSRVSIPLLAVDRALDQDVARRVVRRYINRVRFCAEQHHAPEIPARIDVEIVVGTTGAVQSASAVNGSAELGACLEEWFRELTFPALESGVARISLTIALEPGR